MWRSIDDVHKLILAKDLGSKITKYYIRQLAKSGKIESLKVGSKILINFTSLKEFLKIKD